MIFCSYLGIALQNYSGVLSHKVTNCFLWGVFGVPREGGGVSESFPLTPRNLFIEVPLGVPLDTYHESSGTADLIEIPSVVWYIGVTTSQSSIDRARIIGSISSQTMG